MLSLHLCFSYPQPARSLIHEFWWQSDSRFPRLISCGAFHLYNTLFQKLSGEFVVILPSDTTRHDDLNLLSVFVWRKMLIVIFHCVNVIFSTVILVMGGGGGGGTSSRMLPSSTSLVMAIMHHSFRTINYVEGASSLLSSSSSAEHNKCGNEISICLKDIQNILNDSKLAFAKDEPQLDSLCRYHCLYTILFMPLIIPLMLNVKLHGLKKDQSLESKFNVRSTRTFSPLYPSVELSNVRRDIWRPSCIRNGQSLFFFRWLFPSLLRSFSLSVWIHYFLSPPCFPLSHVSLSGEKVKSDNDRKTKGCS